MQHLNIDIDSEGVAILMLDHAQNSANLVSPEWIEEMSQAIELLAANDKVEGIVIASAKSGFMAGADLRVMLDAFSTMTAAEGYAMSQAATKMHRRIEQCGKPVAAAINGWALGGGFELCLACHRRFLADDSKAVVGLPEVTVGLLPGSGGTQRLPRLIGVAKALPLLLEGTAIMSAKALELGLVDELVPAERLIGAARAWILQGPEPLQPWDRPDFNLPEASGLLRAETAALFAMETARIVAKHGHNYPAPIAILTTVFEGVQLPFDRALDVESRHFAKLLADPVARNMIRTGFVNKGLAEKGARRPAGVPPFRAKTVGVIGAGMMGAGIALVSAIAGLKVFLLDTTIDAAERARAGAARRLGKDVNSGRRTKEQMEAILGRIEPITSFADFAACDLVIEAVFEDTAIKADVTAKAERAIPETTIFATNTSSLPIGQLARSSMRPDNFIGLHFFSPVERMPLVEVIRGEKTSDETLARSLDFIGQIRKTPIVVNDSRGFYTSRVFQTLIHEGAAMLGEGVAPALIENAAKAAGFPVGPLALIDEVSLDLPLKVVDQAVAEEGPSFEIPSGEPVMRKMRDEIGRGGRKAGGGFYEYLPEGKKRLWAGLKDAFPLTAEQPDVEAVKKRLLYVQAMESARCLERGVITHPEDGDLGSLLGWSFPTYTGGTLSLIDTIGIEKFVSECDRMAQQFGPRFAPSAWLRDRAARGAPFYA